MAERGNHESPKGRGSAAKASAEPAPAPVAPVSFDFGALLAIADSLPVMVAYCDTAQVYRFCNRPIADWFERPRDQILGHTVREIMGEAAYAIRQPAIEAALAGERQWFAASFDHPTRGPLTTQAEYVPHQDGDGHVVGIVMIVQDLTEQRAAEVALRESEARFRRIANSAPAPMWVTRADGSRDFVNEAYIEFFGFAPDELGQHDWHKALHPDDAERFIAEQAAGIGGGGAFELTGRFRRGDGEWRWVRSVSQPRRDADGRTIGFIGVGSDITEAKEAELELRRLVEERTAELSASEARFRAIFDSVSTVIVLLQTDGTVIDVNHAAVPWRDGDQHDLIGKRLWDSPTLDNLPDDRSALQAMVAAAARGEQVERSIDIERPGGASFHLEITMLPVRGDGDEIDYILIEARNITELKAAQDQLRQSQKMEALGQLTGGIAHDFNNLLTVVVGGLDMIAKKIDDPRLLRYATNALSAAERGARLTAQLLAFSRVQRLEVRPTSVAPLIKDMRPLLRNVLGPGITKEFHLDPDLLPVMADPTQLELAVLNLTINARDAMAEGGTLSIAARKVAIHDDAELEAGDYVELSISDTGCGMEADVAARAFEPFFTTKEVGKGTGLGLSMVYGMARQSGGTARIESAPATGTTVRLYFHHAEEHEAVAQSEEPSGEPLRAEVRQLSVLVIDDDPDVRSYIVSCLEECGYRVSQAADGPAGMEVFARILPDVAVIDFVMPTMSGAQVAEQMLAARPEQKILFVSGYSETDAIRRAAPDALVLAKPFRADALDAAIHQLAEGEAERK
ncbi:MAG: PAS domain-containing protein [Sphingomicrobium sp.]